MLVGQYIHPLGSHVGVVLGFPSTIQNTLTGIGRSRIKRSRLGLRNFLDLSIELTGRCLVESDRLFKSRCTNGIEDTQYTDTVAVGRVFGHIKAHLCRVGKQTLDMFQELFFKGEKNVNVPFQVTCLDVTHGSEVVNFGRLDLGNDSDEVRGIAKITIVQKQLHSRLVTIAVDVVNTPSVERGRTTDDSVDLICKKGEGVRIDACPPKEATTAVRLVT
jgi:hypothetical protein